MTKTGIGARNINQDAIYVGENLFIVCDGVGGSKYGEVASKLACSSFADYFNQNPATIFNPEYLNKALQYTIQKFRDTERKYPETKGMGTTVVLVVFDKVGAVVAWLGDSRLYHIRKGQILFATEDHSLINELSKQGDVNPTAKRNYITKSLSATCTSEFSIQTLWVSEIEAGDFFFLCTDGVLENVTDSILCDELKSTNTLIEKAEIIFSHCEGKTSDNFTFQIIEV